jgi:flagellar hook protein FlgE
MMASLFAGVSGLKNHQTKMNVVGDNIANVNTIGFKMGRVTFQEALVQTLRGAGRPSTTHGGSNPLQLGLGMSLASIDNLFIQGGLETTGQTTDLAIQGSGFFVLSDGQQEYYTRAGSFGYDADSNLVNPSNGFILQGKMADVNGNIPANATIGNIRLPFGQQDPARATTQIQLGMNLNASATDSRASLVSAGTSNITTVSGLATNGSGGTHRITITGSNAQYSQQLGAHARQLDDFLAAHSTLTSHNDGAGVLTPGALYHYTIVATNSLGESVGVERDVTIGAADDSVVLDWSAYPDLADATSVRIYRRLDGQQYTDANNGFIAEVAVGGTNTYTDLGVAGTSTAPPSLNTTVNLSGQERLSALGVTNASGFQISLDNGDWVTLSQLTINSTVNDLISAINSSVQGVTASIVDGQVELKRDYAGSPTAYNIRVRDLAGSGCDICTQVFGNGINSTFTVNNGAASTLQAVDVFTPNITGVALDPITLDLVVDENTGIITGIEGLGGGGVTISAGQGGLVGDPDGVGPATSSTVEIRTLDTEHSTSITVYDSQGGKHNVTITFTKSWGTNEWFWEADVSGNEIIRSGGSGTVKFNPDGSLSSFNFDGGATGLRLDPNNGAELMDIDILAGTPAAFDGLTSFSSASTASARSQDGYGVGILSNISIDPSGCITGIFTNGVSRILAQIYIADFNNPAGLLKSGSNMYQTSANSGTAILGQAGSTTSSTITSGALEISNVDLAQEFTNMIVAQRGFQANARIITTSDAMLQELVNLRG